MPITKAKASKTAEQRRSVRKNVKLLVGFRCADPNAPRQDGFARAVSLSGVGTLLELPDPYRIGAEFDLEFLLDDNFIAPVQGKVVRINKRKDGYEVGIEFSKLADDILRKIEDQTNC
jgi:hypothetical protein